MAKQPATYYFTGFGTLGFAYIAKPDDTAPEGANWKPDGKFKGSIAADDGAHDELRAKLIAELRAKFPNAPDDDDMLLLPIRPGEAMSGKKAEQYAGQMVLEAKSDYKPAVYDSFGEKVPEGVTARSGDVVRFKVSPYYFSKDEEIQERVNGKIVKTKTTIYGVSLRLAGVQIKRKGGGGGDGGGGFDAIEGGEFSGATAERDAPMDDAPASDDKPKRRVASGADF